MNDLIPYWWLIVAFGVGALVSWMAMSQVGEMENLTKEEVLQCQQIVLDGLNDAKNDAFELLLKSNDIETDVKAMDALNQLLAGTNRVLLELQNFAVNEDMDPIELSREALEVYVKVKGPICEGTVW